MANDYFDITWRRAEDELEAILRQEASIVATLPERNRNILLAKVSSIYLRYITVARQLDHCYQHIVHVQKRDDMAVIIRAVLARIVELKNELCMLDYNESPYIGMAVAELQLPSDQIDPPMPMDILTQNDDEYQSKKYLVKCLLEKFGRHDQDDTSSDVPLTWDEAVSFIQIQERARQGRLRFQLMKQIRADREKKGQGRGLPITRPAMNANTAAIKLQSIWRGYVARREVRLLRRQEMAFLGMITEDNQGHEVAMKSKQLIAMRHQSQIEYQQQYQAEFEKLWREMRFRDGIAIKEHFLESIRHWYMEYKTKHGKFPEIPAEEDGGSRAIADKSSSARPSDSCSSPTLSPTKQKKDNNNAAVPSTAPVISKGTSINKKDEDDKPKGAEMTPSVWIDDIIRENHRYYDIWRDRQDIDYDAIGFDKWLLRNMVSQKIEEEMRIEADGAARGELEILKSALDRDKGKKAKKTRKAARKSNKKAKRGRKEKDLTPDRSLESLIEELVVAGVIRSYPEANIQHFLGHVSIVSPMNLKWKKDSFSSLGDVRCALIEHCIIPMGLSELRQRTPLTRSILLTGPQGVGKTFLVHAICNQLGATLFDLSCTSLMGRYPAKAGMGMLIHLITKLSRLLEPSVILIEDIERMFMKKSAARAERFDMKRMRKELPKLVRSITAEDRVLLIGTTRTPWECDQKTLTQCFQRMIAIPVPDYGTRYLIWKESIYNSSGVQASPSELTNMTRISDSYSAGSIVRAISEVLSDRRKQLLNRQSIKADEFVPALARCEPVYKEDEDNLRNWYSKTPLRRKRHRNADVADGEEDFSPIEETKTEKKKKKKKKKRGKGKK